MLRILVYFYVLIIPNAQASSGLIAKSITSMLHIPPDVLPLSKYTYKGAVLHVFSHIKHVYQVFTVSVADTDQAIIGASHVVSDPAQRWITAAEIDYAAIPTNMKKAFTRSLSKAS